MRRPSLPTILLAVLAPVMLVVGLWLGGHPRDLPGPVRDVFVADGPTRVVDDALAKIEDNYYRALPAAGLTDAAIEGMVKSLDDRYSQYFSPKDYAKFRQATNAEFTGVGMEVREDRRGLVVMRIYDESPAQRAGIREDDVIVAADGRSLAGMPSQTSTAIIRGRPGTDVRLTFLRDGKRRSVNVTRATVSVPVVASRMLETEDGSKVAHVALSTFSSGAHGELRQAIDKRLKQGAEGILFDLRHNGGGLLTEARLVSSIFLPEGPIVTTRGRAEPTRTLNATGGAISEKIPVAVLVDRESASASEIVAGALQDRKRAALVGTRTYGKGVFQEVSPLPNGGAIDLTVGQYFLPSGRNLGGTGVKAGQGLKPNVVAPDDPKTERRDETVHAGLRELAGKLAAG